MNPRGRGGGGGGGIWCEPKRQNKISPGAAVDRKVLVEVFGHHRAAPDVGPREDIGQIFRLHVRVGQRGGVLRYAQPKTRLPGTRRKETGFGLGGGGRVGLGGITACFIACLVGLGDKTACLTACLNPRRLGTKRGKSGWAVYLAARDGRPMSMTNRAPRSNYVRGLWPHTTTPNVNVFSTVHRPCCTTLASVWTQATVL